MKQYHVTVLAALITSGLVGCSNQSSIPATGTTELKKTSSDTTPVLPTVAEQNRVQATASKALSQAPLQGQNTQYKVMLGRVLRAPGVLSAPMMMSGAMPRAPKIDFQDTLNGEKYGQFHSNPVVRTAEQPVSTFSIDVDTGAYSNVRRILRSGRLPPRDAVRIEELINYFDYAYAGETTRARPFSITTEVGPVPWNPEKKLVHIGIKAVDIEARKAPPANLVFLVDVSGSMRSADKLGLLKSSLKLLVGKMRPQDRISLVVYAGASGVVLEPVAGDQRFKILQAVDSLSAGGSTNGGAGIRLAYRLARKAYIEGGINRIMLATDGDFNIGTTNFSSLKQLVERERESGISLTTLGFGSGNYNDRLMEQLADVGNGNFAYIDTLNEAQKVLVDQMSSTLNTVASDVKIQIEFNPALVAEYRLLGYENRLLKREDFNNDKVDAGEIGAGRTVTALYEISLVGGTDQAMDPLRYGQKKRAGGYNNELALLRLRYKSADGGASKLIEQPIMKTDMAADLASTTDRYRFSAAVAAFGQMLRGGTWLGQFSYDQIMMLARKARGEDAFGYRGKFLGLVNLAKSLSAQYRVLR